LLAFALAEAKAPRRNSERNIEQRRCDADLQDYHGCALCDALINPRRKIGDASFVPASKRNVGRSEFPISHLLLAAGGLFCGLHGHACDSYWRP
jgi:hypothetical protein